MSMQICQCQNCPNAKGYAFCGVSQKTHEFMEANSMSIGYSRGSVLFREGDECQAIYVMCEGRAKVSVSSREGRTMILRVVGPGDVLGLSAALKVSDGHKGEYEVTVEALEMCRVRVLQVRHLHEMLDRFPDAGMGLARALAKDYRAAFDEAKLVALPGSPAGRLARLILDWVAQSSKVGSSAITMALTHDELAAMTATTRETVTRTLGRFRKEKMIATRGVALTVLKHAELEALSAC